MMGQKYEIWAVLTNGLHMDLGVPLVPRVGLFIHTPAGVKRKACIHYYPSRNRLNYDL
jgi:hypothetical protein